MFGVFIIIQKFLKRTHLYILSNRRYTPEVKKSISDGLGSNIGMVRTGARSHNNANYRKQISQGAGGNRQSVSMAYIVGRARQSWAEQRTEADAGVEETYKATGVACAEIIGGQSRNHRHKA